MIEKWHGVHREIETRHHFRQNVGTPDESLIGDVVTAGIVRLVEPERLRIRLARGNRQRERGDLGLVVFEKLVLHRGIHVVPTGQVNARQRDR